MSEILKIAVIAPIRPEDFYDEIWEGVWEATFDLASFGVTVENLTTEFQDLARQREILERLLGEQMAAIGIAPSHTSALDDLLDRHVRQGTSVITFQGDAPASSRSAFVGADAHQSGTLAAEVLVKLMGGRGHVVSFAGDMEEYQLAGRYAGLRAELGRYTGQVIETSRVLNLDGDAELSVELKDLLKTADGIYVGYEDLARVAEALHRTGVRAPCVGFSNTPQARQLLQSNLVSAVVDENRRQQGYFAVQKAYQAALRRDAPKSLSIPSIVVFSANAARVRKPLNDAFELLVRQRTEILTSLKIRLEEANAELLNLSITDPLTGLLNRRHFETTLEQEAARALRYGDLSLLIVDLDSFKAVNDTYGHQAGDEVLKMAANVLKECCRSTDICARLGGDEFGIILPHSGRSAATTVRERIVRRTADTTVETGRQRLRASMSIGIATFPSEADHVDALIAAADADMYRVKQASRSEPSPVNAR